MIDVDLTPPPAPWAALSAADKYHAVKDAIMGHGLSYGETAIVLNAPSRLAIAGVVERNKKNPLGPIVSRLTPRDGLGKRRGAAGGKVERIKKAARKGRAVARRASALPDVEVEPDLPAAPAREDAWLALPGSVSLDMEDLEKGLCRWPLGPGKPFTFCGLMTEGEHVYCPTHTAIARRRQMSKGNRMKRSFRADYETITCVECQGHGVVARYTFDGSDFEGPEECPVCDGNRTIVRYRTTGVLAKYPGGPLLGRETRA